MPLVTSYLFASPRMDTGWIIPHNLMKISGTKQEHVNPEVFAAKQSRVLEQYAGKFSIITYKYF